MEPGHQRYNDNYETCERTVAELRIYGDDLFPSKMTEQLGLSPTSYQSKGDLVGLRSVVRTGGWFLSSEGKVESLDLRRHLDWLLDLLLPRANVLRSIQGSPGIRMHVTCVW